MRRYAGTLVGLIVLAAIGFARSALGSLADYFEPEWPEALGSWIADWVDFGPGFAMVLAMFPVYAIWIIELSGLSYLVAGAANRAGIWSGIAVSLVVFCSATIALCLDSASMDVLLVYQLLLAPIFLALYATGRASRAVFERGAGGP